jgi:pimeloyl-ACP methyl ester carboxylesterase
MMTSTGSRRVGQAAPRLLTRLAARRGPAGREAAIDRAIATFRLIGSRGDLYDEAHLRDVAARSYDRSHDAAGYLRQLGAVITQPNRTRALTKVRVPTLVLHGLEDPLVSVSGGLALARLIRGAKFVGFSGMGHDLPPALWPAFAQDILANTTRPALT